MKSTNKRYRIVYNGGQVFVTAHTAKEAVAKFRDNHHHAIKSIRLSKRK
jgi:hypothetical protein